jgi:iron(III) transport system substrate-binding protein
MGDTMNRFAFAFALLPAVAGLAAALPAPAAAQGQLSLYCSVQEEWCRPMAATFERDTGIKVNMTRKSTGETLAQLKAERQNPRGDVWWGGTGDPHLQAALDNLTLEYRSPMLKDLHPWAVRPAEVSNYRTVGIYSGALGFSFNTRTLAQKGLPEPKCWRDLANPAYRGEIQVADPNSSGTAYTMLASLVQMFGEEQAFDFFKAMHRNVNQYTRSGAAPARAVGTGETLIGITFMDDAITQRMGGAPVQVVSPCEGTGFEIAGMSIVKGTRNLAAAKRFYDWALSPAGQNVGIDANALQIPSNKSARIHAQAPRLESLTLINYDFVRFGSAAERERLLSRFGRDVRGGS